MIGSGHPTLRYFYTVEKAKMARLLCEQTEEDLIFVRHLYYTNFTEFGCKVTYLNMVSSFTQ